MSNWPANTIAKVTQSPFFGKSLEVNLGNEKEKTCSFDCPFCYLGRSERTLSEIRKPGWFPAPERLLSGIETVWRSEGGNFDTTLLSRDGDSTLHPEFHLVMKGIQQAYPIPMVVFTNGAHLNSRKVLAGLRLAKEVIVRLDAGTDLGISSINQPLSRFRLRDLLNQGELQLPISLQTMAIKGTVFSLNEENLGDYLEAAKLLRPQRIFLQTVSDSKAGLEALNDTELARLQRLIEKGVGVKCLLKDLLGEIRSAA